MSESIEQLRESVTSARAEYEEASERVSESQAAMVEAYGEDVRSFIIDQAKTGVKRQRSVTATLGDGVRELRAEVEKLAALLGEEAKDAIDGAGTRHARITAVDRKASILLGRVMTAYKYSGDGSVQEEWKWYDADGDNRWGSFPSVSSAEPEHRNALQDAAVVRARLERLQRRLDDMEGDAAWGD